MPHDLGRALLLADAVTPDALAEALFCSVREKVSLVRALVTTQAIAPTRLEEELARANPDTPLQKHPVPVQDLLDKLPPHLCEAFVALPVRRDPRTGTIDVALADPHDAHAAEEFSFFLGAPVRKVRSPLTAIELALARVRSVERMRAVATGSSSPPANGASSSASVWRASAWDVDPAVEPHRAAFSSSMSERPVPQHDSVRPPMASDGLGDIPIPLSRRAPARDGQEEEEAFAMPLTRARAPEASDADDPVVELRRIKSPAPGVHTFEPTSSGASSTALNQLLREMGKITSRDPLMELVLIATRPVAHKCALFAVKKDAYVGWMCTADFGDRAELAKVSIPMRVPSFLAAAATVGQYVGPLLRNAQHEPFLPFMRSPRPDVVAIAIRAAARPAVILVAHEVGDQIKAMPFLHDIARAAGDALEKIVLTARSGPSSKRA